MIPHGSRLALQLTASPLEWLSCSENCHVSSCPGLYIEDAEWSSCGNEVFEIYRAVGSGELRVGDLVGLYQPAAESWLGCNNSVCTLSSSCLPVPSTDSGFYSNMHWPQCREHVFKVEVRNKRENELVHSDDDMSLLLSLTSQRLTQQGGVVNVAECESDPINGKRFEECRGQVFTLRLNRGMA